MILDTFMHSDDKNTFDSLMKQAEFLAQRMSNRQSYQWKISFALWAALGFALNLTIKTTHPGAQWITAWSVGGVSLIVLQCWWLGSLYAQNRSDIDRALNFRDEAEKCLIVADYKPAIEPFSAGNQKKWDRSFVWNYGHGVELSITVLIILFGIFVSIAMNCGTLFQ
jgi:hypothetical protein